MYCVKCGEMVFRGESTCQACQSTDLVIVEDTVMEEPYKLCPFCAEKIHPKAIKCKHCQEMLNTGVVSSGVNNQPIQVNNYIQVPTTIQKSRAAYIILGLFLGSLGVHNFYAGYVGRGIAQLLISILTGWLIVPLIAVWIWVIVEICAINEDANGLSFN